MAHHKSALKRIRQNKKRRLYNRLQKKQLKLAIKAVREAGEYDKAIENFKKATKLLDKLAVKGVIHKNNAGNKKSRLAKLINKLKTQEVQQ